MSTERGGTPEKMTRTPADMAPRGRSLGAEQPQQGIDAAALPQRNAAPRDPIEDTLRRYVAEDDLGDVGTSIKVTAALNAIGAVRDAGVFGDPPVHSGSENIGGGEDVAREVYTAIAEGRITDRLPSESDLVDETGHSRATVREGLTVLKAHGIVESRKGFGTSVTNSENIPDLSAEGRPVSPQSMSQDARRESPGEPEVRHVFHDVPLTRGLERFVEEDDGSDVEKSMAATFALNAMRRAEEVVFGDTPVGESHLSGRGIRTSSSRIPLGEQVAQTVYEKIANGDITGVIPSEDELGRTLGVSRQTIREGLSILSNGGVIEIRHGLGGVVTNRDTIRGADPEEGPKK